MGLIIQSVRPKHFSKELLKYIFMKLNLINIWWITLRIKPGTQGLRYSNLQSGSQHSWLYYFEYFNEVDVCIIKFWDIIY